MRCSQPLIIAFLNALALTGCVPITDPPHVDIAVVSMEGADPPEVGPPIAYKLRAQHSIDPDDPELGQAAELIVTVSTQTPESVKIQLLDGVTGRSTPIQRMFPDALPGEHRFIFGSYGYAAKARSHLLAGRSVFWSGTNTTDEPTDVHRLHIVIPAERITPFMQLEFSLPSDAAASKGAVALDLVQDFLYMAVIGDSILWGSGLEEKDKITTHVVDTLERETGRRVVIQLFAQNGATLIPKPEDEVCTTDCNAEAPTTHTSITTQAGLLERGELIELVLMNGCINDIDPARFFSPLLNANLLAQLTEIVCGQMMEELLEIVHSVVPRASVMVTGYYPIISTQSDLLGLQHWLDSRNIFEVGVPQYLLDGIIIRGITELLAERSLLFDEVSRAALTRAVDTVNGRTPGLHRVSFVDPGFGPENAAFAPETWLWSLREPVGDSSERYPSLEVALEDSLIGPRTLACTNANVVLDALPCYFASVGHPNPRGARAYADAIISELRTVGMLPRESLEQDSTSRLDD